MTNKDIKIKFINRLMARDEWTKKQSDTEYVTRCPYCGDSSDPSHGHFYINVNLEDNSNIVYNCFKCPAGGVLTNDTLVRLGIDDIELKSDILLLNKTADVPDKKQIGGELINIFEYHPPKITLGPKTDYIKNRLGYDFRMEDYQKLKVITSFADFVEENHIKKLMCSREIARMLDAYYVGFLSYGNSHILFRDVTDKMKLSWVKYPITEKSRDNRIFYSISSQIDPYTEGLITINLCEGVIDAASIYYNLGYCNENTITIAVTGKYYEPIVRYLIGLGLFGSNVELNIFADNDAKFNKKNKAKDTNLEFYKKIFKNIKFLFKNVRVYYNILRKDCGYPKEFISLVDYKL